MKPVTVSEATRFVSLLFSPNKMLFTAPPCLNQWQKLFKQLIALIIMLASTAFYNPAFAQANVQFPDNPNQSLRSDVIGGQWVPVNNLFNDGSNIIIQPFAPFSGGPTAPFSTDFRLSVFGERIVQVSGSGNIGTAFGDRWNAIGDRLPFTTSPGFRSNGLRSQWDGFSANFGVSDDPVAGSTIRHGLIQWQDVNAAGPPASNSRLRFVFRDGQLPPSGAYEYGSLTPIGNWGFGLNNIAPLSTVDVKGGLYVGSSATVTAGTGDGYFSNSVRLGSDAFMSTSTTQQGVFLERNRRIGIGTSSPSTAIEIDLSPATNTGILMKNGAASNGLLMELNGQNFSIQNLQSVGGIVLATNSGTNPRITVSNVDDVVFNANLIPTVRSFGGPWDIGLFSTTEGWRNIYGTNNVTSTSDINRKKKINNLDYGLKDILKLRPVSYQWKDTAIDDIIHLGFIAQEVNEVIPNVVVKGNDETMMMRYSELIPVLVSAIQEQNKEFNILLSNYEKKVENLEIQLKEYQNNIEKVQLQKKTYLYQNEPNPFSTSTLIKFEISTPFSSAKIIIAENITGQIIKEFLITTLSGQVSLTTENLNKFGIYNYSLVVDNKVIETRKMLFENR